MKLINVLVVEDNAPNRRLVADLLKHNGYEVAEAKNVSEALAFLENTVPDLVLLDIQIPGGGGEVVFAKIRADRNLCAVPVIAVTAFAMAGDPERFIAAGFDGYISKPIDTKTFCATIETIFDRARERV